MNSNLELISTNDMTPDNWLEYRKTGVGASEIGTIMGLNPYKASIQLFYEKLGLMPQNTTENMAMFMGKELEPLVAKMWQFWDGDEDSMINNMRDNRIIQRCQRVNAYVRNPKFPWLFVSLDRKANKNGPRGEGAVECKTISGYEADKWEASIPTSHVVQVQGQILVCEFNWGDLPVLQDGRRFFVYPFETHNEIQQSIIDQTHNFWKKVETALKFVNTKFEVERKQLAAKQAFNFQLADSMNNQIEDLTGQIDTLAPEPDGSDAYMNFLKDKYRLKGMAVPGEMNGTDELKNNAVRHKEGKEKIKLIEAEIAMNEQVLKLAMKDNFELVNFGDAGSVSWKANKNGVRTFRNNIKA